MESPQVLEGTWEEIKLHERELAGRTLRVVIAPKQEPLQTEPASKERVAKRLQGRGAFKGKLGGVEAYLREKQADIEREEHIL